MNQFLYTLLLGFLTGDNRATDDLWLEGKDNEISGDFASTADQLLHQGILEMLSGSFPNLAKYSEETCGWSPDQSILDTEIWSESGAFLFDPWDGTMNRIKIAGNEVVFPAYGILISRVSKGEASSSVIVGRFFNNYYALSVEGGELHYLEEIGRLEKETAEKLQVPCFRPILINRMVIPGSIKKTSQLCAPFQEKGLAYLNSIGNDAPKSFGCAFGNVFAILLGYRSAYANTGHGFVYDYLPLIHLFQVMGGYVVDLAADDGIFKPTHAQRPVLFLHPELSDERKREFLGIYLEKERVDSIMERISG
jgi:fructose-1,6-bisphosphatase/inositol monophosphatase family enzyme